MTRQHLRCVNLASLSSFSVSKHLKVILENIDDFIRLKCSFNLECNPINELVKLFLLLFLVLDIFFWNFFSFLLLLFLLEIGWIIHRWLIHWPTEVRLSLNPFDLMSCLQTNLKSCLLGHKCDTFNLRLKFDCIIRGILIHKRRRISSKLFPGHGDSHLHQWSTILDNWVFYLLKHSSCALVRSSNVFFFNILSLGIAIVTIFGVTITFWIFVDCKIWN